MAGRMLANRPRSLRSRKQAGFGPHLVRHLVPFRPADGAEDHRVAGIRLRHGVVGDGDLVGVVAGAADQAFLGLEIGDARLA